MCNPLRRYQLSIAYQVVRNPLTPLSESRNFELLALYEIEC
jgi:hypothetical protein